MVLWFSVSSVGPAKKNLRSVANFNTSANNKKKKNYVWELPLWKYAKPKTINEALKLVLSSLLHFK